MSSISQPTFEQLALIIEDKLGIPHQSVTPGTSLKDIEIDSLALVEVALAAEEQFGVPIPTDDLDPNGTAEDFYQFVLSAVSSRA